LAGAPVAADAVAAAVQTPPWKVSAVFEELLRRGDVRGTGRGAVEALAPSRALPHWSSGRRRDLRIRLIEALPPGGAGRLRQLVAAGFLERVPEEALATSRRLTRDGRVGEARVAVLEGLIASRESVDLDVETELLRVLVEFSLLEGRAAALDEALYWLARSGGYRAEVLILETIARAALLALKGDGARALELLGSVDVSRHRWEMERLRWSVAVFAARYLDLAREEEVVGRAVDRAEASPARKFRASAAEWLGWLRYRQGSFAEAARLHEEASELAVDRPARLSTLLNAASAWMEAGALDRAADQAARAVEVAAECRHPLHESRAEWLARAVAYRRGDDLVPDLELVSALEVLGAPNIEALTLLTEAAVAWRCGDRSLGGRLAGRASAIWGRMGHSAGRLLADALARACGAAADPDGLVEEAKNCTVPGIAVQSLGLLARAEPALRDDCLRAAREAAEKLPEETWPIRREVISVIEALAVSSGERKGEEG
jgi:tetratricopeptide (TPR) repeat protein